MRRRIGWMVAGGALVLAGQLFGMLLVPMAFGQREAVTGSGHITCESLTIVDEEGKPRISLFPQQEGGFIGVFGADGSVNAAMSATPSGGTVFVTRGSDKSRTEIRLDQESNGLYTLGANGTKRVLLSATPNGGDLSIFDRAGNLRAGVLVLDQGVAVSLLGKDAKRRALMLVSPDDTGSVATFAKDGTRSGELPDF
ncbi:MAG: hypothetical protein O3A46_11815 [Candidatus Poribacteria bacterium]|nr:hypothetical protein [Candidatus Poribacteria bacterium]